MLGCSNNSIEIICGTHSSNDEANVIGELAWPFWLLETLPTLTLWKHACRVPNNLKYCDIWGSFASKLPSTWLTTSLESENISTSSAPNFWAALSPVISASYLASLLEAWKPNLSDYANLNPSGVIVMTPAPDPLTFDAPSTKTCHGCTKTWHTLKVTPSVGMNFATNFANTWPLIEFLDLYQISNVPSLVPHFFILPINSDLYKSSCRGYSVSTQTMWAWK